MKHLLLCMLALAFATPALAQTPVSDQAVQAYVAGCVKQPSRTMDAATLTQFCQCSGLHIQKNMSLEEVKAQAGNDQAARNALNKVVTQVYAPCMEYPVRALVALQCKQNPETAGHPQVCACAADSMALYTQREAQKQLPQLLAANPNMTDPSAVFMSTPQFEAAQKQIADTCGRK